MDDSDDARTSDSAAGDETTTATTGAGEPPAGTEHLAGEGEPTAETPPPTDEVPAVAELVGPRRTLESEIQAVWLLRSSVYAVVLGIIVTVAFSIVSPLGAWVGGVVFAVVFLLGVVFAVLRYRSWSYEVREDSLYLERGVLTHVRTVVPYVRIQHVDASRGPVERAFGLATTVVYTAGSRGADVSIPGLTPERAEDLQTRLKQLAIAAEGEDAV